MKRDADTTSREFDKYIKEGAYHWELAHNTNPLRQQLKPKTLYSIVCDVIEERLDIETNRGIDVGCGDGAFMYSVQRRGGEIVGVDVSREGIKAGREEFQRRNLPVPEMTQADATRLPFCTQFEYAVGIEIIEHVPDPDSLLAEVVSKLDREGLFVCTTPTKRGDTLRDHRHVQEFSAEELEELLHHHFESVRVLGYFPDSLDDTFQTPTRSPLLNKAVRGSTRIVSQLWNPYRKISTSNPDASWSQLVAIGSGVKQ